jgi:hypothetical protein
MKVLSRLDLYKTFCVSYKNYFFHHIRGTRLNQQHIIKVFITFNNIDDDILLPILLGLLFYVVQAITAFTLREGQPLESIYAEGQLPDPQAGASKLF